LDLLVLGVERKQLLEEECLVPHCKLAGLIEMVVKTFQGS
jgi:hypothetical protein